MADQMPTVELLHRRQVQVMCSQPKTSLYRGMRNGTFPLPVKTPGGPRWRRSDIVAWLEKLEPVDTIATVEAG